MNSRASALEHLPLFGNVGVGILCICNISASMAFFVSPRYFWRRISMFGVVFLWTAGWLVGKGKKRLKRVKTNRQSPRRRRGGGIRKRPSPFFSPTRSADSQGVP